MDVAFFPRWPGNPYQSQLAKALEPWGIAAYENTPAAPYLPWLRSRQSPYPYLHFHWPEAIYNFRGAYGAHRAVAAVPVQLSYARRNGFRIVWTMHNERPHDDRYRHLGWMMWHQMARFSHAIIVHCDYARTILARKFQRRHRVFVVPHGNFIGVYGPRIDRRSAREDLALGETKLIMLYIGYVKPYKGMENLIDVFSQHARWNAQLVIAGKPTPEEYGTQIEQLARRDPRIICRLGWVENKDIARYLGACDVVVLPFTNILTSGSLVMAMSYARPVIAPDCGCLPEYVGDRSGLLYAHGDPNGLAKALDTIGDLDLVTMGQEAFHAASHWSWSTVGDVSVAAYRA